MSARAPGAVVTGAGRGIGAHIAAELVRRGYLVLVTDVDQELAQAVADDLGAPALALRTDVRRQSQTDAARDALLEHAGRLDVWVNNAGVLRTGAAWEQDETTRRQMLEVNALGTINGTISAISAMRGQGGGHVINIASLAGLTPVPGEAVYAASKHAVIGFSLSTLSDLRLARVNDIDISCICPDGIWTPMLHDKLDDPASAMSFSGRLLQPHDVVRAIGDVLERPRPVTSLPAWRGLVARAGSVAPRAGLATLPFVRAQGRRAQRRLIASRDAHPNP